RSTTVVPSASQRAPWAGARRAESISGPPGHDRAFFPRGLLGGGLRFGRRLRFLRSRFAGRLRRRLGFLGLGFGRGRRRFLLGRLFLAGGGGLFGSGERGRRGGGGARARRAAVGR